ncbi:MAG TPA: molybdenum cofactor biosynthesis protein MoaE [Acidimicrobiales bacterium]|jgi:molybdopterin synthase catalytic subunit|nr:molybdenum cofactor biosynthesis protein MoaE [Acidimicrobiales bacterium]
MQAPATGEVWLGLSDGVLPVAAVSEWVVRPDCGAVVVFSGTARDHAPGRPDVERLEYEAYDEQVEPRLRAIADEMRTRWPTTGRIAMIHRTGIVPVGDSAVVVAVSAPHRDEAFHAARFGIDAIKASAPIWKHEAWSGGAEWGTDAQESVDARRVGRFR